MDSPTSIPLRLLAMNLLARREYSEQELRQKLLQQSTDHEYIDQVVKDLIDDGLQSDTRFTEAFTKMRLHQGKGSVVVGYELKQRGISQELIDIYVKNSDAQWKESLLQLIGKRFAGQIADESREKVKQLRFLQSRGFTLDQINQVLSGMD